MKLSVKNVLLICWWLVLLSRASLATKQSHDLKNQVQLQQQKIQTYSWIDSMKQLKMEVITLDQEKQTMISWYQTQIEELKNKMIGETLILQDKINARIQQIDELTKTTKSELGIQ